MDRTIKALLALIAVALWGLLLRPYLALHGAEAASPPRAASVPTITPRADSVPAVSSYQGSIYVVQGGRLYIFQDEGLHKRPLLLSTREISTKP